MSKLRREFGLKAAANAPFKLCAKFESLLDKTPLWLVNTVGLSAAFAAMATGFASDDARYIIANTAGVLGGLCVIARQAGFKKADNMKKLNIGKSSGGLVQYVLTNNWPAVAIHVNGLTMNNLFSLKAFKSKKAKALTGVFGLVGVAGVTTWQILNIAHDSDLDKSEKIFNASIQALPLAANTFGVIGAAQEEGKWHRLSMGAAGGISVVYDTAAGAYGMLVSSVGSTICTGIGWWKHDRKKSPEHAPAI